MRKTMILVMLLVFGVSGLAFAYQNPDSMTLKVLPQTNLSVNIAETEYNFGTVPLNTVTISTYAITVTNDSNLQESYNKYVIEDTSPGAWILVPSSPGNNQYALWSKIDATQPSEAGFDVDYGTVTKDAGEIGDTLVGGGALTSGAVRSLWFKLNMPVSVSGVGGNSEQSVTFYIKALAD